MRKVGNINEVCHAFAHGLEGPMRNSTGSVFRDGEYIYSYGRHFPMARRMVRPGGRVVFLVTTDRYSVTTSKQQTYLARAIPMDIDQFHVPVLDIERWLSGTEKDEAVRLNHAANYDSYRERVNNALGSASRATKHGETYYRMALRIAEKARAYCQEFEYEPPDPITIPNEDGIREHLERQQLIEEKLERERQERRLKENEENIAKWRRGERASLPFGLPPLLRTDGETVYTSWHASFPVSHARRAWRVISMVIRRGRGWVHNENDKTIHLGHFAVDYIKEDGTVKAGCHIVAGEEVIRLARDLELEIPEEVTS